MLFGLNQSSFILGATLKDHLEDCEEEFPSEAAEIKKITYADDVTLGVHSVRRVEHLKNSAINIFNKDTFTLHKWHSNRFTLETENNTEELHDQSLTKEQLGTKDKEIKLLGLSWGIIKDRLSIPMEKCSKEIRKRSIFKQLTAIYDPLGLISVVALIGKIIFRNVCNEHVQWDEELPERQKQRWIKWVKSLPENLMIKRSIPRAE